MCIYSYIHVYTLEPIQTTNTYRCTHIETHLYAYTETYVCIYTCIYVHAYIHYFVNSAYAVVFSVAVHVAEFCCHLCSSAPLACSSFARSQTMAAAAKSKAPPAVPSKAPPPVQAWLAGGGHGGHGTPAAGSPLLPPSWDSHLAHIQSSEGMIWYAPGPEVVPNYQYPEVGHWCWLQCTRCMATGLDLKCLAQARRCPS